MKKQAKDVADDLRLIPVSPRVMAALRSAENGMAGAIALIQRAARCAEDATAAESALDECLSHAFAAARILSSVTTPIVVRGYVSSYGGGVETVAVDRDTSSYLDGEVVIVPAELWDAR